MSISYTLQMHGWILWEIKTVVINFLDLEPFFKPNHTLNHTRKRDSQRPKASSMREGLPPTTGPKPQCPHPWGETQSAGSQMESHAEYVITHLIWLLLVRLVNPQSSGIEKSMISVLSNMSLSCPCIKCLCFILSTILLSVLFICLYPRGREGRSRFKTFKGEDR